MRIWICQNLKGSLKLCVNDVLMSSEQLNMQPQSVTLKLKTEFFRNELENSSIANC